jgi:plastocyanin
MTLLMKFFIATFASLLFALPAMAIDITMGSNGNLVFEPSEIDISAGETVHFVNGMLPPQ